MKRQNCILIGFVATAAAISQASAATVAYWKFDDGGLTSAAVGGPTYNLTNNGSYSQSQVELVDPIPNPDGAVGAGNNGSVFASGAGDKSFIAGANSVNAMLLSTNSWTFEGWLEVASVTRTLDPVFTTRGGQSGNGLLLDLRNGSGAAAGQTVFNLFIDGTSTEEVLNGLGQAVPLDEAFHFALTFDSAVGSGNGRFELFINGASAGTHDTALALAGVDALDTTQLELLGRAGDTDGAFGGRADEFRISDTALAPSQFLNAIPEPGSAGLTLIGLLALTCSRRRRTR